MAAIATPRRGLARDLATNDIDAATRDERTCPPPPRRRPPPPLLLGAPVVRVMPSQREERVLRFLPCEVRR
ncbi:hypothetical protein ACHAW5_005192 [Stephanodiscus triporus]|uniref:Uncharacterized protein n=1 Tax=Stephanodiscus triporus TaxID=2934178 RepID=A0ABD3P7W4_9STRA